jgi:hypothetical protein
MGPGGEFDDGASDISSTSGFSAYGYRSGKISKVRQNILQFKLKKSNTVVSI